MTESRMRQRRFSTNQRSVRAGSLLVTALLSCGSPPAPEAQAPSAPEIAVNTCLNQGPAAVAQQQLAPLDLVDSDGEVLLYFDAAEARKSLAYALAAKVVAKQIHGLADAQELCDLSWADVLEEVASSVHSIEAERVLIIARHNAPPEKMEACVEKLAKGRRDEDEPRPQPIGGHPALAVDRKHFAVAVDNLVFVGGRTEVSRALERLKTGRRSNGALRQRLGEEMVALPFVGVVDSDSRDIHTGRLVVGLDGQALTIKGHASFRDMGSRKGANMAKRFAKDVRRANDELREVTKYLFREDAVKVDHFQTPTVVIDGRAVRFDGRIPIGVEMAPFFRQATVRFGASEKTSEAKNTIGAIARGATAAFEREQIGPGGRVLHVLCSSSTDVPKTVPRATTYTPSTQSGQDYSVGDQHSGWRCTKFEMTGPQIYQYAYRRGGNYKGPPRGLPDPGPNGFEVSAEGDLDGDGITSLFTVVGVVDPQSGHIVRGRVNIDNEFE